MELLTTYVIYRNKALILAILVRYGNHTTYKYWLCSMDSPYYVSYSYCCN